MAMIKKRYLTLFLLIGLLFLTYLFLSGHKNISTESKSPNNVVTAPTPYLASNPFSATAEKNLPASTRAENNSVATPINNAPQTSTKTNVGEQPSAYERYLASQDKDKIKPQFIKISFQGKLLNDSALDWSCVYDKTHNLLWEVKLNDGSWQDTEHTYSWYKPLTTQESLLPQEMSTAEGLVDGGSCYDIFCDTENYKNALNDLKLCGVSNWRIPEIYELGLLDHRENYNPDIDTNFFPNTASKNYWSNTQASNLTSGAWAVNFINGFPYITEKYRNLHVRLVANFTKK